MSIVKLEKITNEYRGMRYTMSPADDIAGWFPVRIELENTFQAALVQSVNSGRIYAQQVIDAYLGEG